MVTDLSDYPLRGKTEKGCFRYTGTTHKNKNVDKSTLLERFLSVLCNFTTQNQSCVKCTILSLGCMRETVRNDVDGFRKDGVQFEQTGTCAGA